MGKRQRAQKAQKQSRGSKQLKKLAVWAAVISLTAGFIYVVVENSGVPYDEHAIAVVDFSSLDSKAKKTALQAANRARCTCTCGMQLAQCVATDSTCPVRSQTSSASRRWCARRRRNRPADPSDRDSCAWQIERRGRRARRDSCTSPGNSWSGLQD